jgi:hypothetical protein
MLNKCANPACPNVFRSLRHGKLFLLEIEPASDSIASSSAMSRRERIARRVERYWLCDCCASLLTLTFERGRGMVTVPLPSRNSHASVSHLKQLQPIKGLQRGIERSL